MEEGELQEVLHQKIVGALKKWLIRLADALKRLAGKAAEALPTIAGSVAGAILGLLGKAVGFVAEHTWALIVFAAGLIGVWLMQRVKKKFEPDDIFTFIKHRNLPFAKDLEQDWFKQL